MKKFLAFLGSLGILTTVAAPITGFVHDNNHRKILTVPLTGRNAGFLVSDEEIINEIIATIKQQWNLELTYGKDFVISEIQRVGEGQKVLGQRIQVLPTSESKLLTTSFDIALQRNLTNDILSSTTGNKYTGALIKNDIMKTIYYWAPTAQEHVDFEITNIDKLGSWKIKFLTNHNSIVSAPPTVFKVSEVADFELEKEDL